jgi:hypothetical protein
VIVVLPETPTKAKSISLGTVVVIWVNVIVAVEALYFPLVFVSIGLAVFTPIKEVIAPVAGWLEPNIQVYEAGSEAEAAL